MQLDLLLWNLLVNDITRITSNVPEIKYNRPTNISAISNTTDKINNCNKTLLLSYNKYSWFFLKDRLPFPLMFSKQCRCSKLLQIQFGIMVFLINILLKYSFNKYYVSAYKDSFFRIHILYGLYETGKIIL